jgi:hypothetical protein
MASDAYRDGVWWVPLVPRRDPALVLATADQVLGSTNGLAEHIADKAMLFDAAWDQGRALTLDEAVAFALGERSEIPDRSIPPPPLSGPSTAWRG